MNSQHLIPGQLLPHRGRMLFIDSIDRIESTHAMTHSVVRPDNPFLETDVLNRCALIEYMAQTVAALQGHRFLKDGGPVRVGFLIGIDRFEVTHETKVTTGTTLTVSIDELSASGDFGSYACEVRCGDITLATGIVKVFSSGDSA